MARNPGNKVAAFCRELADDGLEQVISDHESTRAAFARVKEAFTAGRIGPELIADLDELDRQLTELTGYGIYPPVTRYDPLPGAEPGDGAQWWTCPHGWCAGRGRVIHPESPPLCGADRRPLKPGPFPE